MLNILAHVTGTIARIEKNTGDAVIIGETLIVLESMKMEVCVEADVEGTVREIRCRDNQAVSEGDILMVIE